MADASPHPVEAAARIFDPDGRPSRRVVRGVVPAIGSAATACGLEATVMDTVPAPARVRRARDTPGAIKNAPARPNEGSRTEAAPVEATGRVPGLFRVTGAGAKDQFPHRRVDPRPM